MRRLANSDATNAVCSLPRLRGRDGGGGRRTRFIFLHAPSLTLPRLRGRGHTECAVTILPSINHAGPTSSSSAASSGRGALRLLGAPTAPTGGEPCTGGQKSTPARAG